MKKIASLVLVVLMMLAMVVPAVAETNSITALAGGMSNIPFDNEYRGYCIDYHKSEATKGYQYVIAEDTSIADNNNSHDGVSQLLKVLFTQHFETLFEKVGETYELKFSVKDSSLPSAIWDLTDDRYNSGEGKQLANAVRAYTGPEIPDHNYQLTLDNGDIITFDFIVLIPIGANADSQSFFAYKLDVQKAGSTEPEEKKVTVTFNSNGGNNGSMENQIFDIGDTGNLTSNAFTKEGYTFTGWNTKPDGTGDRYTNEQLITVNSNITLYAQWEKNPVVTFDTNGGIGSMDKQEFKKGVSEELNENKFTRENYEFTGWNTKPDGSGDSYDNNDSIIVSEDITLYAQWKEVTPPTPPAPEKHFVTFDPNCDDINSSMNDQEFEHNVPEALNPNEFERDGYEFTGWNTKPDGSGTSYTDEGSITVDSNITLYAQWKEVTPPAPPAPEKHIVTFDPNCDDFDGSMDKQEFEHDVPEALNPNEFEREGYEFTGWNTEPDGSGKNIPDQTSVTVNSGDVTLYAQWEKKEVTPPVNPDGDDPFNPGDGEVDDQEPTPEFPATGDASAPMLWLAMFALSIFGFIQMRRKAATR